MKRKEFVKDLLSFCDGIFKNESKEWAQGATAVIIILLLALTFLKLTGGACL